MCVKSARPRIKASVGRKAFNMAPQPPLRETESENLKFFLNLPDPDRTAVYTQHGQKLTASAPLV